MASRFSAKDAKADVKLGRNDGGTALMFAAQEGHLEVAKQLGLRVWWPLQMFAVRTSIVFLLHPGKLTCPLKRDYFSREYIFQPLIFRGHVGFQGCMLCMVVYCCVVMTNGFVSSSPWCYYGVNNLNIMVQHCRLRFYSQTFDRMRGGTYCQPLLAPSNISKDGIDFFFWIFSILATQGFDWAATRCLGTFFPGDEHLRQTSGNLAKSNHLFIRHHQMHLTFSQERWNTEMFFLILSGWWFQNVSIFFIITKIFEEAFHFD